MTSRRRFISILAGAAALPMMGQSAFAAPTQWRGIALGANAQIILDHPDAADLINMAVSEIRRLELLFSLYQPNSLLSQLNQTGTISAPAFEFIELLSIAATINTRTNGAFDPTIQTLWELYADLIANRNYPDQAQIEQALEATGWDKLQFSVEKVTLADGAKLSLNGIAQGYITDKIAALFRANGIENVLVNTGEISALGTASNGLPWVVTLGDADGESVDLQNACMATSAPLGTTFDNTQNVSHILDPRNGRPATHRQSLTVIDSSSAVADGLSTGFCLMGVDEINKAKGRAKVIFSPQA